MAKTIPLPVILKEYSDWHREKYCWRPGNNFELSFQIFLELNGYKLTVVKEAKIDQV